MTNKKFKNWYENFSNLYPCFISYHEGRKEFNPNQKETAHDVIRKVLIYDMCLTWKECFKHNGLDMRTNRCKDCLNLPDCHNIRKNK